ncbi:MAG: tyrosine-type recombinase/integrase [Bacteroidota bacterium]
MTLLDGMPPTSYPDQFRDYLVQLGYRKTSVQMLPGCVNSFLAYHPQTDLPMITSSHIHQFYDWLQVRPNQRKAGGLSETYISHHVYALRVFFNWLEMSGQIQTNPISVLQFKRPKANTRQPLSQGEIAQLFAAASTLQEMALLHLFYSCGLRRSEGAALNLRDVHFGAQLLYVRAGKGAKRRVVPMTPKVSQALESYYLQERVNQEQVQDTEAFMLNRIGKRLDGDGHNRLLKTILARTAISQGITLHHLRHSIATHLLASGLPIEKVRDFLGHRHLESTQLYAKVHPNQLTKL